jgi:hypothetical protein
VFLARATRADDPVGLVAAQLAVHQRGDILFHDLLLSVQARTIAGRSS